MKVAFIPGDGVGPEVTWAARRCVEATGARVEWELFSAGLGAFERTGESLPRATLEGVRRDRVVLQGPLDSCAGGRGRDPEEGLREALGVFASVRRCRALALRGLPADGMDLQVIVQELPAGGGADRRFFDDAFDRVAAGGRRRVTLAHRGSADADWVRAAEESSRRHPALEYEEHLVGHVAMQLARSPHRFDAIVAGPGHGPILGDLAVGLAGGLGWVPAVYPGTEGALFTSVHGTAPKYAGLDRVNPVAMVLAAAEMLDFIGFAAEAGNIATALEDVLRDGARTADWPGEGGSSLGTRAFAERVVDALGRGSLAQRGA